MKTSNKAMAAFGIATLSLSLITACGGSSSQPAGQSGTPQNSTGTNKTMVLGMVNPPVIFNPINSSDVASSFVEGFFFDSLLDMTAPLKFSPELAESFDTKDNQHYTIKLNPKAKWSDGQPITAKDVVYTINLVANPKVETAVGAYIAPLAGLNDKGKLPDGQKTLGSVKQVDDYTVELTTKQPVDPNMLKEQLGSKLMILPEHVVKNIAPDKLSQSPFAQKPNVTSSAFQFVQYVKDQYVELKANPSYYRGAPKLDKIFIKLMPAPNLVAQLKTGEIQMNVGLGIGKIPAQDYETVEKMDNVRYKVEPNIGFQTMQINNKNISDPRVRQAILYALDRQLIVKQLLKGKGEVVDGPYTSVSPYLDKNIKVASQNIEKAKQLLKEAGWDSNKTLSLVVPTGNIVREQSANIIQQNLEAAGFKVKVTKYDFPTIMQKGRAGDFDLLLIGFTFTLDPDVSSLYGTGGAYNFMKYSNPDMDKLLAQGKAEADTAKRHEIYNQVQSILEKDVPVITLYSDYDMAVVSKKVAVGESKYFGMLYDLNQWSFTGAQ